MAKTAVSHKPGDIVTLAGIDFVVLEERGPDCSNSTETELFIVALKSQGQSEFGSSNDYNESDLQEAVDKWLYRLTERIDEEGGDDSLIKRRTLNLMTLDGYKGFDNPSVLAAPLTLDEARKYAEVIPDPDEACWLATGWGGPEHFGSALSLGVNSSGLWGGSRCSGSYGVRPALVISSLLLDSDEPDLSDVPTEKLLEEIRRRIGE